MLPKPADGSLSSVVALARATQAQRRPNSFVWKEGKPETQGRASPPASPLLSVQAHILWQCSKAVLHMHLLLPTLPLISVDLVSGHKEDTSIRNSWALELETIGLM